MKTTNLFNLHSILKDLKLTGIQNGASTGVDWLKTSGTLLESYSPIDGNLIGSIKQASAADYEKVVKTATKAFVEWRKIPAPKRGEVVRQIGEALRENRKALVNLYLTKQVRFTRKDWAKCRR